MGTILLFVVQTVIIVLLTVCAVQDARERMISVWLLAAIGLMGVLHCSCSGMWPNCVTFVVCSVVLIMASMCTSQRLGLGDSLLLIALIPICGGHGVLMIVSTAATLIVLYLAIRLLMRFIGTGKGVATELPLVPFIACGYIVRLALQVLT